MAALFAVGLMSKPMLVTLPLVLLLLDYWPLGRFRRPAGPQVSMAASARGSVACPFARLVFEKLPLLVHRRH